MTRHYRRDELAAYLDRNDAVVNIAEVEEHLAACRQCRNRLEHVEEDLRMLPALLGARSHHQPPPVKAAEFAALSRQKRIEDADAEILFPQLLDHPRAKWLEHLAGDSRGMTAGMVGRITRAARDKEEREPETALEMLDIAEALLGLINARVSIRNDLAGTIWKERANTLTVLGDYPAALTAVDHAETFYRRDVVAEYFLAFTRWVRGTILFEMGRHAEALQCTQEAATALHSFAAELQEWQIAILMGSIQYELGNIHSAISIFKTLVEPLRSAHDSLSVARVLSNLAFCHLAQFEEERAEAYARQAETIFRNLGIEIEVIRVRWAYGRAYLRRGDSERGIAFLTEIADEFRARNLVVDAAEVDLDIIEEHLRNHEFFRAAEMARRLVTTFTAAESKLSAAKALAHLAEASAASQATLELVRYVRHVLTHPRQEFRPPDVMISS